MKEKYGRNYISKASQEGNNSHSVKVMLHNSTQTFFSDDFGAQPAEATKQY